MKSVATLIIGLLLGLAISSCNQSDNQKKILGKWKGTYDNTCRDPGWWPDKTIIEYEFTEDGMYIMRQSFDGNLYSQPEIGKYQISGDSLIWNWESPTYNGEKEYIYFMSDNELIIKKLRYNSHCEGITLLKKN